VTLPTFEAIFQGVSLLVLAVTVYVSLRQLKDATRQAKSSEDQAKASVKMAQLSLEQTELMRTQVHASFRPVVRVTTGDYASNAVILTLKNVGTGPALGVVGIYRSKARQDVGDLSPGQMIEFRFEHGLHVVPPSVGPPRPEYQSVGGPSQTVPLRLEYQSVSGASCWTTVDFKLGGEGPVEAENESGMDLPSLTANAQNARPLI